MTTESPDPSERSTPGASTLAWVGPFAVFVAWMAVDKYLPLENPVKEIVRDIVILASIVGFSRRVLPTRAPFWLPSIAIGLAVCAIWIAPDALFPGWRSHWLFTNSITGQAKPSIPPSELSPLMIALRFSRAALLVPVVEELFWRGWLARWIQDTRFARIPLGQFTTFAFVATAVLFALEHGPYWEVGLLCGVIYNWWMWRTRSLGDLILVHAVTNAALCAYVLATGHWEFM